MPLKTDTGELPVTTEAGIGVKYPPGEGHQGLMLPPITGQRHGGTLS
jgi:hypothetical protein